MARKKLFSEWESELESDEWSSFISLNTYKIVKVGELPEFIKKNGVSQKFNSALVVASGSADQNFYGIIGYRPDKRNTVIDEHAFVYIEDKNSQNIEGGIIHHASYDGRTTELSAEMTQKLNDSGVTTEISMSRLPTFPSGSLDDLKNDNIMNGVTANFYSGSLNVNPSE